MKRFASSLFDICEVTPVARATDPETSHQAARSVRNMQAAHEAILSLLKRNGRLTDEQIYEHECVRSLCSPSGARTRRSELVSAGLVKDSGFCGKTVSGRKTIMWEANT